MDMCT